MNRNSIVNRITAALVFTLALAVCPAVRADAAELLGVLATNVTFRVDGQNRVPVNTWGDLVYAVNYGDSLYLPMESAALLFDRSIFRLEASNEVLITGERSPAPVPKYAADKPAAEPVAVTQNKSIAVRYIDKAVTLKDGGGKTIYPIEYRGAVYLPVRALAELFGKTVSWDGTRSIVFIDNKDLSYENAELGLGIRFPAEYKDKFHINVWNYGETPGLTVVHDASQEALNKRRPANADEIDYNDDIDGYLFFIQRWPLADTEAIANMAELGRLMLKTDKYAYYMRLATDVEFDELDPNGVSATEYPQLFDEKLLEQIVKSAYAVDFIPTPVYGAENRVGGDGLEDDMIYAFTSGVVNPDIDRPLLLINGRFISDGFGLLPDGVIEPGKPYVPIDPVANAVGGFVGGTIMAEDGTKQIPVTVNGHTIVYTPGSKKAVYDGKEVTLANAPIQAVKPISHGNDYLYVALDDDFVRYWNLDAQYLPDADMPPFAYNPIVVIDDTLTREEHSDWMFGQKFEEYAKKRLTLGLENMIKNNAADSFVGAGVRDCEKEIRQAIDGIEFVGWAGRYMMLSGPYPMLADQYTGEIYFYQKGASFCRVVKADVNDPNLFALDYIGNL